MAMGALEMPPSQQIFEMVVFQGKEIQALTVLQPPPQQQQQYEQQPMYAPPPPQQQSPWGQPVQEPVPAPPVQQQKQEAPASTTFGSNPWGQTQQQPSSRDLPAPAPAPTVSVASVATEPPPKPKPLSYAHAAGGSNPTSRPAAPRGGGRGGRGGGAAQTGRGGGGGAQTGRGGGGGAQTGRGGGRGGAQPARGGGRGGGYVAQPLTIPNEEFDFQQSLTKFDKDKIAEEARKQIPSREEVYNKDDFFDSLSCEALERQNNADRRTNGMRAKQRRTDVATFGYQPGEGRGRGRGRSTRGGRHTTKSSGGGVTA